MEEYIKRLDVAHNHLNFAVTPEEIDQAVHEIRAAEIALDRYVKERRVEHG